MPKSRSRSRKPDRAQVTGRQPPMAGLSTPERVELDRRSRYRARQKRQLQATVLMSMGVLLGVTHLVEHFGVFTLYRSGVDDLLVGYPMAGVLFVAGAIRLPAR